MLLRSMHLMPGDNVLIADVNGPNESSGTARAKFEYAPVMVSNSSVNRLIPSVAVQAVALPAAPIRPTSTTTR